MEMYSLMEAIILSGEFGITWEGKLMVIFMTERPVVRKKYTNSMLRMLQLLPSNLPFVKDLKENLLTIASFKCGQVITVRQVKFQWVNKLIDVTMEKLREVQLLEK